VSCHVIVEQGANHARTRARRAQWGDEGKGKATDQLSGSVDYVVKFNGGNNAGHTVVIGDETYALHLLPSGILSPGCTPVIGNGVVVDLSVLFEEIDALEARGVSCAKLVLSADAHLIASYNRTLDKVAERFLGNRRIGTTGRGIGPTYADKMNRIGIRVQDLFDEGILRQKVEGALELKNQVLVKVYNRKAVEVDAVVEELLSYVDRVRPMVADTSLLLNDALDRGETVLLEGGQATLLDVDHGTYPFVTSSSATAGGACTGSGIGPAPGRQGHRGRQGLHDPGRRGPVPHRAARRRRRGAARHRPRVRHDDRPAAPLRLVRRVIARYAARVNGVTDFVLTKLDVLTGRERIPVCVAYEVDGKRFDEMPMSQTDFHHARPVYEYLDGWTEDITGARTFDDLPKTAQAYVTALEQMSGAPFSSIGVGPDREQTLELRPLIG
jgi:adenylosuccinate synthase